MEFPVFPTLKAHLAKEQIDELKEAILINMEEVEMVKPEPFDDPLGYIYVEEYLELLRKLEDILDRKEL